MKFKTTSYHFDLLKDWERLASFYEAICQYDGENNLAYDLGCGSGVLSYFLSSYFKEIIAIEIDEKAYGCAFDNLSDFENISVINNDVLEYDFTKKADLIVCEMLDTALIDEEQLPVLAHAKKFLKSEGKIIPQGIINQAELVSLEREYVHWDEGANYEVFSDSLTYGEYDFLEDINPDFEEVLSFKVKKDGIINGIKLTTITKLNDNLVCGPTPMLNPALLIPLDEKIVKCNDLINVKLKYIMGEGIESIKSQYY
ncbi:MAG: 50S ribosomal protein L11 methyltransferase [Methanobrevibacter sp.]|nr:50S ribosomal protein L11 methyltransferase [Methanobrevibacter sp.]